MNTTKVNKPTTILDKAVARMEHIDVVTYIEWCHHMRRITSRKCTGTPIEQIGTKSLNVK